MPQVPGARAEFLAGVRAFAPLAMSIVPFGLVCGAAAAGSGISFAQALAMSWVIFAGSAQIASTQLHSAGAPLPVIVATAAIINLRFLIYGASLARHFAGLDRRWQAAIAYLLTDQAYALTIVRAATTGGSGALHWFYIGLGGATWIAWQLASLAGILLGNLVPPDWSLDFVVPLTFIAMLVPLLGDRAMLVAALAGGLAAVLLVLPLKLELIAAALIGVAAGLLSEHIGRRRR